MGAARKLSVNRGARVVAYKMSGSSYFEVIDFEKTSPLFDTKKAAEEWLERQINRLPAHKKRQPRDCMCCGEAFISAGFHNRMCDPCRSRGGEAIRDCSLPGTKNRSRTINR